MINRKDFLKTGLAAGAFLGCAEGQLALAARTDQVPEMVSTHQALSASGRG